MTATETLREIFLRFTDEQKANVRMHLDNGVPVLAEDQASLYSSTDGGL